MSTVTPPRDLLGHPLSLLQRVPAVGELLLSWDTLGEIKDLALIKHRWDSTSPDSP